MHALHKLFMHKLSLSIGTSGNNNPNTACFVVFKDTHIFSRVIYIILFLTIIIDGGLILM